MIQLKPERKLRYLSEYMNLVIDEYPKKQKPFDMWLESTLDKKAHKGTMKAIERKRKVCRYCGRSFENPDVNKTKDHVVPISKGGLNIKENRVYACGDCNQWKADMPLSAWLKEVKKAYKKGVPKIPYHPSTLGRMIGNIITVIDQMKFNKKKIGIYKNVD